MDVSSLVRIILSRYAYMIIHFRIFILLRITLSLYKLICPLVHASLTYFVCTNNVIYMRICNEWAPPLRMYDEKTTIFILRIEQLYLRIYRLSVYIGFLISIYLTVTMFMLISRSSFPRMYSCSMLMHSLH